MLGKGELSLSLAWHIYFHFKLSAVKVYSKLVKILYSLYFIFTGKLLGLYVVSYVSSLGFSILCKHAAPLLSVCAKT